MSNIIHKYQEYLFNGFIIISYLSIFLTAFGFPKFASTFLPTLEYYVRIYICLFLIWRFNPLRKHIEFTNLDRKISFSAGLIILTTSALNKYLEIIKSKTKQFIDKSKNKDKKLQIDENIE